MIPAFRYGVRSRKPGVCSRPSCALAPGRPRTPWGQSDLNCADIALDVPALAGSGTAGVAVGVLSNARHLAACSAWGRRVGLQRFAGAKHARITGKGWSSTLPSRMRASQLHTPAAFTRTSSCPVAGSGRGRSSYVITFGGPNRTTRAALICPFDGHARSFHFITLTVLQVDCQGFRALFFSTLRNGAKQEKAVPRYVDSPVEQSAVYFRISHHY